MSLELNEWEIHINEIKLKDQIGEGQFGKVFLASWRGTNVVAKVINKNVPEDKKHLFIKEFDIMTKIHHPYVVQLLGYVKDPFIIVPNAVGLSLASIQMFFFILFGFSMFISLYNCRFV